MYPQTFFWNFTKTSFPKNLLQEIPKKFFLVTFKNFPRISSDILLEIQSKILSSIPTGIVRAFSVSFRNFCWDIFCNYFEIFLSPEISSKLHLWSFTEILQTFFVKILHELLRKLFPRFTPSFFREIPSEIPAEMSKKIFLRNYSCGPIKNISFDVFRDTFTICLGISPGVFESPSRNFTEVIEELYKETLKEISRIISWIISRNPLKTPRRVFGYVFLDFFFDEFVHKTT